MSIVYKFVRPGTVLQPGGGGAGVTILNSADWGTATGTSDNALGDGGAIGIGEAEAPSNWNCLSHATVSEVFAGTPLGWTDTPNVVGFETDTCVHLGWREAWPAPAAGAIWVYRFYFMASAAYADSFTNNIHGAADIKPVGTIEAELIQFRNPGVSSGHCNLSMRMQGMSTAVTTYFVGTQAARVAFEGGAWYRFEGQIRWLTDTTYRLYPRIYTLAGTLVADATDFIEESGSEPSLQDRYDQGEFVTIRSDAAGMREFAIGVSQTDTDSVGRYYFAKLATGTSPDENTWIGV